MDVRVYSYIHWSCYNIIISLYVHKGAAVVHRILPTPSQRTSDFKIQLIQKDAGLILLFDNGDDMLSIRPQKYEQPYVIKIKKEGKIIIVSLILFLYDVRGQKFSNFWPTSFLPIRYDAP